MRNMKKDLKMNMRGMRRSIHLVVVGTKWARKVDGLFKDDHWDKPNMNLLGLMWYNRYHLKEEDQCLNNKCILHNKFLHHTNLKGKFRSKRVYNQEYRWVFQEDITVK